MIRNVAIKSFTRNVNNNSYVHVSLMRS